MRRTLIALAAILIILPLQAATPQFGPERPLSRYEYGDPGSAWSANIATDGAGYLAVWSDQRRNGPAPALFAARLRADGTLIDQTSIVVADEGSWSEVVWTGSTYVVAWRTDEGVWIARVSREGQVSGKNLVIEDIGGPDVALATTGNSIFVGMNGGPFAVLDMNFSVRARGRLGNTSGSLNTFSVAASRNQYLVAVALEARYLVTYTITENGSVSGPAVLESSEFGRSATAASDGTSFLVVWTDESTAVRGQIVGSDNRPAGAAQTYATGTPLTGTGQNVRVVQSPDVAWSGGEYLVTFFTGGGSGIPQDASAVLVSREGLAASDPRLFGFARGLDHANAAAKNNGSGVVIWTDAAHRVRAGLYDATSIATRNPFYKEVFVARAATVQEAPAVVEAERTAVAAWIERSADVTQVRLSRAGGNAVIVDTVDASRVWLAYDGDVVAVVWELGNEVRVRRYNRGLEPIDQSFHRFAIVGFDGVHSVAAANGIIVWTWTDGSDLYLTRLEPEGNGFRSERITITPGVVSDAEPGSRVMWDGTQFVIVWRQIIGSIEMPESMNINASYVSLGGQVQRTVTAYHTPGGYVFTLHAAARNGRVVVAWQEPAVDDSSGTIYTFVGSLDGGTMARRELLGTLPFTGERLQDVEIHRDGKVDVFWVQWPANRAEAGLRVQRLTPQLEPVDDAWVSERFIRVLTSRWWDPDADAGFDAAIVDGQAVMVYARRDDSPQAGGIARLFVRTELGQTGRRRAVR